LKYLVPIVVLILGLVACGTREQVQEAQRLDYTMMQVRVDADSCVDSTTCASFEVNYPVFTDLSPAIAAALEQYINDAMAYDNPEAEGFSMQQKGERFIADFESFRKQFPDNTSPWYYLVQADVLLSLDTLISIAVHSEFFTGGAHGGFNTFYVNFNPQSGKEVTLSLVLKPGHEQTLIRLGEKAFRDVRVLDDTASFAENGFDFPGDQFKLNTNYGFRPEGIVFFFNPYEVAPYAQGSTEFLIPFEALTAWRR
jgi:hypothetical protein